jgi:hypothetical protein
VENLDIVKHVRDHPHLPPDFLVISYMAQHPCRESLNNQWVDIQALARLPQLAKFEKNNRKLWIQNV